MDAHHGETDRPRGVSNGGEKVDVVRADELAFFHEVDHCHEIVQDAVGQRLYVENSRQRYHVKWHTCMHPRNSRDLLL